MLCLSQVCQQHPSRGKADLLHEAEVLGAEVWDEEHDAEMARLEEKGKDILLDAVNQGGVCEDLVDVQMLAEAGARKAKQRKADKGSLWRSAGRYAHFRPDMSPGPVQLCEGAADPNTHFFVADVLSLEAPELRPYLLVAALNGRVLCNPEYILSAGDRGACVAFRPAIATKRQLWMSECFRQEHPVSAAAIDNAMTRNDSKWRQLDEATFVQKMLRNLSGYGVIGIVSAALKRDDVVWSIAHNVFSACQFTEFISVIDPARSACGGRSRC